jgi:hypothetical protein
MITTQRHRYVTWEGFEVDRYMAAWLIKRYIDPKAEFLFLPIGTEVPVDGSIAFDVPGGRWFRGNRQCTSDSVFGDIGSQDSTLERMVGLVRQLEMAYWLVDPTSDAGRMNSAVLRITDDISDPHARMVCVFKYLDDVYAAGGSVPGQPGDR